MILDPNKNITYIVTSDESETFESDDAEEAIYIFKERKNEKGVQVAMKCHLTNELVILGGKRC